MVTRYQAPPSSFRGISGGAEVWVLDRSLKRTLMPVPFSSLDMARTLNDTSSVRVDVPVDDQAALYGVRAWAHGLGVWDNGRPQWWGPITSVSRGVDDDTVTIEAFDKLVWTKKRWVNSTLEFLGTDCAYIFDALIADATSRDNRFGLTSSSRVTGVPMTRTYRTDDNVFAALQELSRAGLDFTMVMNHLYVGPAGDLFDGRILANESSFLGRVGVEYDGLAEANSQVTFGGRSGGSDGYTIAARFEDWGEGTGLLEQREVEDAASTAEIALSYSRRRWEAFHDRPRVVTFPPLSPSFPVGLDELVPGKVIRFQAADPLFDVAGDYRLTELNFSVEVAADGSQSSSIKPVLQVVT